MPTCNRCKQPFEGHVWRKLCRACNPDVVDHRLRGNWAYSRLKCRRCGRMVAHCSIGALRHLDRSWRRCLPKDVA